MNPDPARAYRQLAARSASPVELVLLLYDAALDSLHRAVAALKDSNIEQRIADSNHALEVIGELQAALDFEQGGQVARRLERFYNIARAKILEANIKASPQILEQLTVQFLSLREAWQQVERSTSAPAALPAAASPSPAVSSTEPVASHWSA